MVTEGLPILPRQERDSTIDRGILAGDEFLTLFIKTSLRDDHDFRERHRTRTTTPEPQNLYETPVSTTTADGSLETTTLVYIDSFPQDSFPKSDDNINREIRSTSYVSSSTEEITTSNSYETTVLPPTDEQFEGTGIPTSYDHNFSIPGKNANRELETSNPSSYEASFSAPSQNSYESRNPKTEVGMIESNESSLSAVRRHQITESEYANIGSNEPQYLAPSDEASDPTLISRKDHISTTNSSSLRPRNEASSPSSYYEREAQPPRRNQFRKSEEPSTDQEVVLAVHVSASVGRTIINKDISQNPVPRVPETYKETLNEHSKDSSDQKFSSPSSGTRNSRPYSRTTEQNRVETRVSVPSSTPSERLNESGYQDLGYQNSRPTSFRSYGRTTAQPLELSEPDSSLQGHDKSRISVLHDTTSERITEFGQNSRSRGSRPHDRRTEQISTEPNISELDGSITELGQSYPSRGFKPHRTTEHAEEFSERKLNSQTSNLENSWTHETDKNSSPRNSEYSTRTIEQATELTSEDQTFVPSEEHPNSIVAESNKSDFSVEEAEPITTVDSDLSSQEFNNNNNNNRNRGGYPANVQPISRNDNLGFNPPSVGYLSQQLNIDSAKEKLQPIQHTVIYHNNPREPTRARSVSYSTVIQAVPNSPPEKPSWEHHHLPSGQDPQEEKPLNLDRQERHYQGSQTQYNTNQFLDHHGPGTSNIVGTISEHQNSTTMISHNKGYGDINNNMGQERTQGVSENFEGSSRKNPAGFSITTERNWEVQEKAYSPPQEPQRTRQMVVPRVYGRPEQNYEVDESASVMTNGRVHGVQPIIRTASKSPQQQEPSIKTSGATPQQHQQQQQQPQGVAPITPQGVPPADGVDTSSNNNSPGGKKPDDNQKVGYVVEGRNFRKYRVEERTSDGFIVGEYGVVSHDDGTLRGVRYTADGTTSPRLIYDALMKFLAL